MNFSNISLPKMQKEKLKKIKLYLCHGNVEEVFEKLDDLIGRIKNASRVFKLSKLKTCISNNQQ